MDPDLNVVTVGKRITRGAAKLSVNMDVNTENVLGQTNVNVTQDLRVKHVIKILMNVD